MMSQQELIRQQRALIDVLKGALAALGGAAIPSPASWISELTEQERTLIGILYAAYPRTASRRDLLRGLPGRQRTQARQPQAINVLVHKIRTKLGPDTIVTDRTLGFRLGQRFYETLPKDAA